MGAVCCGRVFYAFINSLLMLWIYPVDNQFWLLVCVCVLFFFINAFDIFKLFNRLELYLELLKMNRLYI